MNARSLKGGKRAEDDAADAGRRQREETCHRIDPHFVETRGSLGRDRDQQPQEPRRDGHAEDAAGGRHQRALGKHLQRQANTSSAECRSHGELVLPRGAARDQQVGDVDAGHEQQTADGAEQDEQREPHLCHEAGGERLDAYGDAAVGVGMFALKIQADCGQLLRRRFHVAAGHEPADRVVALMIAAVVQEPVARNRAHRDEQVVGSQVPESWRHHADHDVRAAVEKQRRSQHALVAAHSSLPEFVAHHDRWLGAGAIVCCSERASEPWLDANDLKKVGGRPSRTHALRPVESCERERLIA